MTLSLRRLEPSHLNTSRLLGRYELLEPLGQGGMATVYLGRARGPGGFHKWVALKCIHPHLAADRAFVDMFLDEGRLTAAVQHPNVAQVFELGEARGEYFLAMEYLNGVHLGALCERIGGPLESSLIAYVIACTAKGLHQAHEARDERGRLLGLVHRDVSPQNIFITFDGHVKITDFGVARAEGRRSGTTSGRIKGKVGYLSPEQIYGRSADRRSDVFALGTVFWELSTGRCLFASESEAETLMRVANHEVIPPSQLVKDFPTGLDAIVMRALEREPAERFQTAQIMGQALDVFVRGLGRGVGPSELAELMAAKFADEICERDEQLRGFAQKIEEDANESGDIIYSYTRELAHPIGRTHSPLRSWIVLGLLGFCVCVAALFVLYKRVSSVRMNIATQKKTRALIAPRASTRFSELRLASSRLEVPRVEAVSLPVKEESVLLRVPAKQIKKRHSVRNSSDVSPPRANPEPIASPELVQPMEANGYLNLLSRPWAEVYVHGELIGRTPMMRHLVPAGRLELTLKAEGKGTAHVILIDISPGKTVSRRFDFSDE